MIEHFAADVLDFFFNNLTTIIPPEDPNYKIIQSIGALGTFFAFVAVAIQTFLLRGQIRNLRTQTELLQYQEDYDLRPWIYLVPWSDSRPVGVNIDAEKHKVIATIKLRNRGKLATIFRHAIIDIDTIYMNDLRHRPANVNFVEAFIPNKKVTFSWATEDEGLMKEIFKRGHLYIGFLIEYHYTDRVRNTKMIGIYEVIFLVNVFR
ncbi:MAG: hypothetical protein WBX01_13920 [Nitrososphaeraceae archaeon]